ncbi:CPBP family intramembrane glutamic endopeptidase [Roseicitreum antarcticum]|uniref:CAAX prenyl protease 2/Lysostaphin resistance protein A-like domain-containing protein n=1 Tax=Roseicitreum antarcticum TaxID=564137 RepID=A0A1H2QN35_9RHOB|nr:CPBP family intramembrane glutamic endopeptidase [Roseicitreum antarcticum]SDW08320.1 hypothetical protein SAMN04488238_10150 [Roseicitreum antarcticum]
MSAHYLAPPFAAYVQPARQRPQLWRLILGLVLVFVIYASWMALMGVGLWLIHGSEGLEQRLAQTVTGSTPVGLLMLLASFAGMALGVFAAVRWLHRRPIASLFGRAPVVLRDFCLGAGVMGAIALAGLLLLPDLGARAAAVSWQVWLAFLPLALLGLMLQTGTEELLFRGYIQQQLAARFASPVIWMIGPSVLFGMVHYAPDVMGPTTWYVVLVTGFFGLVAADLTRRSGSIGLAWGLHLANNFVAIMIVTAGGGLDALALYRLPFAHDDLNTMRPLLFADMGGLALAWAICALALRGR